jgi:hypothetical protein
MYASGKVRAERFLPGNTLLLGTHPERKVAMINNRGMVRAGAAVLAGAAALFALAGCSSGSSSSSAATGATPSATASPSSSTPSWASALGSGVTVVAPETVAPGNDSPGAVMTGVVDALNAKKYTALCSYVPPSEQSKCKTELGGLSASALAGAMPFAKNAGLGYVAIDGTEALVGSTGEYCTPGQSTECYTNNDPAAILNSGKPFSALWKTAVAAANSNSSNVYELNPCVEVGGKWYADISL